MKKNPTKDNKEKLQFSEWNLPEFDCNVLVFFTHPKAVNNIENVKFPNKDTWDSLIDKFNEFDYGQACHLNLISGILYYPCSVQDEDTIQWDFVDNITSFKIISIPSQKYRDYALGKILD